MKARDAFETVGWCRFGRDPKLLNWVDTVFDAAVETTQDPEMIAEWLRCGDTWFAGVNALPNDPKGKVADGPALSGMAVNFIEELFGPLKLDPAQISVIYPGYPRPMEEETPAAFRFRQDRDAAHVDGLLPIGAERRRHLQEPHSYVLGVPLTSTSEGASPLVVWEGSHQIMRRAFRSALHALPPMDWSDVDLTDTYQEARRKCFAECRRVVVHAQPGEAYLIHRLALHGVAKWEEGAVAPPEGRMIAYFRPELDDIASWIV